MSKIDNTRYVSELLKSLAAYITKHQITGKFNFYRTDSYFYVMLDGKVMVQIESEYVPADLESKAPWSDLTPMDSLEKVWDSFANKNNTPYAGARPSFQYFFRDITRNSWCISFDLKQSRTVIALTQFLREDDKESDFFQVSLCQLVCPGDISEMDFTLQGNLRGHSYLLVTAPNEEYSAIVMPYAI